MGVWVYLCNLGVFEWIFMRSRMVFARQVPILIATTQVNAYLLLDIVLHGLASRNLGSTLQTHFASIPAELH